MFKLLSSATLGLVYLSSGPGLGPAAAEEAPGVLVSTQWLADHLRDPDLVLLHVAMLHEGSPKELIPGARVLDYHTIAVDKGGLPVEMPPLPDLVQILEEAGVTNDKRVVVYGEGSPHMAARVFVTLDYVGHGDRTSVLDGGLEVWKAEGRALATKPADGTKGRFVPRPREDLLVSADWIAARLDDPSVALIDARPAVEYTGERKPAGLRGGHIPGAYNLFFQDLVVSQENPRLKDLGYVRARFEESGPRAQSIVVNYCYIGMRASYTYLISRHLGFNARFYDPSWAEWGRRPDLPLTAGEARR